MAKKLFSGGIDLTDQEVAILEYMIHDPEEWIMKLLREKIANTKDKMIKENMEYLLDDPEVENISADKDQLVEQIRNRPFYKDRRKRDKDDVYVRAAR